MLETWLSFAVRVVRERRAPLLFAILVITLGAAFSLRGLEADPSPRSLLASADLSQDRIGAEFRERFGSTDNVIALIVEAPDGIVSRAPLGSMYVLTERLSKLPHVERVESLTRTPFRRSGPSADGELSLDDIEEEKPDPLADDPKLLGALSDVVAAAPELFPMGLATLSERMASAKYEPLITSDAPSDADVADLSAGIEALPILKGRLISRDGRHAVIAIVFDDALSTHAAVSGALEAVRKVVAEHKAPPGVRLQLSGLPVVRTTIVEHMRRDQRLLTPGTLLISLLMLVVAFRWWAGVVLPLLKVGLTSLWVLGGMALFGVKLNVISNILPPLLIIMGLSDSIHLVSRYVQEYARTKDAEKSMETTIFAIGGACFGTATTTAAGLFALYVSKTRMLAEFGIVGGLGVCLAYLDTVVFLPAMLRGLKPPQQEIKHEVEQATRRGVISTLLPLMTLRILSHPWLVLVGSTVLTVGALVAAFQLRVDSALLDQFQKDDPVYLTTRLLEEQFEGVRPLEVSLSSNTAGRFLEPEVLKALSVVGERMRHERSVISVTAPADPFVQVWSAMSGKPSVEADALRNKAQLSGLAYMLGKRTPSPLATLLTADGKHARLRIRLRDDGSRATLNLITALDTQLKHALLAFPDVRYDLTGDAYLSSHGLDAVVSDLTGSLGVAVLTILLLVTVTFRSFRYALLLIPPNVIPILMTMAWMVIRDIPLNAATAIIFSVSIGITVDAGIHMLSRLREELTEGVLLTTAVMRSVRGTGSAIVVACSTLVLGFSVLLLSNFVPVQRFAELIAMSIISCLVSTLVVLPALLAVVGKRFVR